MPTLTKRQRLKRRRFVANTLPKEVARLNPPSPLRMDPTRSLDIRRRFGAEIVKRLNWLKRDLIRLVVEEDAFGLSMKRGLVAQEATENVFCPTGKGGGVDPTCSPGRRTMREPPGTETIDVPSGRLTVHRNVSVKRAEALFDKYEAAHDRAAVPLRGITDGTNVWLWDSYLATHDDVASGLGIPSDSEGLRFKRWEDIGPALREVRNELTTNRILPTGRWAFTTTAAQVEAFRRWFEAWFGENFLPPELPDQGDFWLNMYIAEAYRRGLDNAYSNVNPSELADVADIYTGSKEEFLRSAFGRPVAKERLKLLAGRAFDDLRGISTGLSNRIRNELTTGLLRGDSPRQTGARLNKIVDGYKNRGVAIAQTETVRALNHGALDAMGELGVDEIGVMVEWTTSGGSYHGGPGKSNLGNPSPCELCAPLEGTIWKREEAYDLFPRHPHCRCTPVPANVGEPTRGQVRGQKNLKAAIQASIAAERPKGRMVNGKRRFKSEETGRFTDTRRRTIKAQRKKTTWAGADARIRKKRPEPVVEPQSSD